MDWIIKHKGKWDVFLFSVKDAKNQTLFLKWQLKKFLSPEGLQPLVKNQLRKSSKTKQENLYKD